MRRAAAGPGRRPVLRRPCHLRLRRAGAAELAELEAAEAAAAASLPLVLLFGAGHVGRALAAALAPLPLRLRWIDGRADEFPDPPPPGVEAIVTDRPLAEIERAPAGSACFVLTHSHASTSRCAAPSCERGDFAYLGLIGSRDQAAPSSSAASRELRHPAGADRPHGLPDRRRRAARQAAGGDRGPGRGRAADRTGRAQSAAPAAADGRARKGRMSMTDEPPAAPLRLELRGITKRFPGVVANSDVGFAVAPGEIHALLGENGAGKSTLVKIIYGVLHADEGEMLWDGKPVRGRRPARPRGRSASAWCSSISRCSRR